MNFSFSALVLRCLTGHFFSQPSTTTDTAYHYEYNGNQMDIIDSKGKVRYVKLFLFVVVVFRKRKTLVRVVGAILNNF